MDDFLDSGIGGAGGGNYTLNVEEPISVLFDKELPTVQTKYNFDFYLAMIAANLFSNYDITKSQEDVTQKIIARARTFGNAVKNAFPQAFG